MSSEDVELGYLARPTDAARGGIVLLHDVWGLSPLYRGFADKLAQRGYATLALELYRRQRGLRIEDPGAFMRELSDPQVLSDVQAGVDYLRSRRELRVPRVAVIGFCMGGMYALLAGAQVNDVAAVVPFYGILSHSHGLLDGRYGLDATKKPTTPLDAARELRCALLAFYGDQDPYVPLADIDALRGQLALTGETATVRVFHGAGHAFMNTTRAEAYRPEAAEAAWEELFDFLAQQLG